MAKAATAAHVTITLDPTIPDTLEAVKERIVSITTDYQAAETKLKGWYDETTAALIKKRDDFEKKADPDAYLNRKLEEMRAQIEEEMRLKIEGERKFGGTAGKVSNDSKKEFYDTMVKRFPTQEVTRAEMATAMGLHKEKDKGKINGLTAIFKALAEEGYLKWNGKGTINSAYSVVDPKRAYAPPSSQTTMAT